MWYTSKINSLEFHHFDTSKINSLEFHHFDTSKINSLEFHHFDTSTHALQVRISITKARIFN